MKVLLSSDEGRPCPVQHFRERLSPGGNVIRTHRRPDTLGTFTTSICRILPVLRRVGYLDADPVPPSSGMLFAVRP